MLWPDPPPPTASTMVHGAVAAIRRALKPHEPDVLVTRDGSYVLEIAPEQVDAVRFERALEAGRRALAVSPQRASSLLAEALAEWRGSALAEVEESFARAAAARLDELRLQCNAVCDGGIMLDLSGMKEVTVDPVQRIARAGPGLLLGELDAATQRHGLATPLGVMSDTQASPGWPSAADSAGSTRGTASPAIT